MRLLVASAALLLLTSYPVRAFASSDNLAMDAAGIAELETRADHAVPREQCFLYTELVEAYTNVAARQLAEGNIDDASASLKRVQAFAERIHMNLARDSKRVKNAEMRVHAASYRLGQFLRQISSDDKAVVETTLKRYVIHSP